MSENNKTELVTIEPEVMPGLTFDFEFIAHTLNLIQIQGGNAAINLTAITDIEREDGNWALTLEHGYQYTLSDEDMAELEQSLKRRIEDNKAKAKEGMRENARMQAELMAEIQGGVQPGKIVSVTPNSRRFRQ